MRYNKEKMDELELWIDKYLEHMEIKYANNQAAIDKINHIKRVTVLTEKISPDNRMDIIAAKAHDLGRFSQLELLGSFNDGKVLHHNLGEDTITRAVFKGELPISNELNDIRQVIQFHGRQNFIPYKPELTEGAGELIDIVSRVDEIENGCIGATGYLIRETEDDVKGYRRDNPNLNMQTVSPEVWKFFSKGEKFDKMKYCKTYADYTLFASVLAIQGLKSKDREIAKAAMNLKCNGYESALEGYRDIFSKLVKPRYSKKAFDVLNGFYNNKDYQYEEKQPDNSESGNR